MEAEGSLPILKSRHWTYAESAQSISHFYTYF
jgi:hypothetical protein